MLLTRPVRILTDKELEEYLKLDSSVKQKKYLEKLNPELFKEYEYTRTRK